MYQAGWGKKSIDIRPRGYAMQGYAMWHHRARGQQSTLYARALVIADDKSNALLFCCLDMGYVTHAMRAGLCERLKTELGANFREELLVLTCTHTHSGPGGCTQDALYNVVTPGFVPEHLQQVIDAGTAAILQAWSRLAPTELGLQAGTFNNSVPVAWNRSLRAYNRNPDVVARRHSETHLALNRQMQALGLRQQGELKSLLSFFGVHATCVGSGLKNHDGDNKGYAALHAEQRLQSTGSPDAVAIFAQATAGDVSPHYHGPGEWARRSKMKGKAEYEYARRNGTLQSDLALAMLGKKNEEPVSGHIDGVLSYVDFTQQQADSRFCDGHENAFTSEPCHGVSFFTGTPVDGRGMPMILGVVARKISRGLRKYRLSRMDTYSPEDRAYYQRLYAAQGPKDILLEAGRKQVLGHKIDELPLPDFADPLVKELKRQARQGAIRKSALVPTVLPLQIVRIGQLALVCCPGEFTTTAGQRLIKTVQEELQASGIRHVLICTYCNEYMGYVTTQEEYQEQAYEGGHTIFGQWTLAAFQTRFAELARELGKAEAKRTHDKTTRPVPPPAEELALRSSLRVPV